jgi:hypothetical protein
MSAKAAGYDEKEERVPVKVLLSRETAERLAQFCNDCRVTPDQVVEHALADYFREGDISH